MLTIQQAQKCKSQNFAVKTHDGHIADLTAVNLASGTVDIALYNEEGYQPVDTSDANILNTFRKRIDPATLEVVPRMDGDTPYLPKF